MKLEHPFLQLPLKFDAERMLREVETIDASAWQPHPQGYAGNDALSLITPYGKNNSDELSGPMRPTEYLKCCPYLSKVLETIGGVWGRTRLMRLSGQAEVKLHVDVHYYWRERMRVHVPIITQPEVRFYCGDQDINMAAGECWIFDTWRRHRVVNDNTHSRIHLVADTIGGEKFWSWLRKAKPSHQYMNGWKLDEDSTLNSTEKKLRFETTNVPNVMTPWEMREHFSFLFGEASPHPALGDVAKITFDFCTSWQALWSEFGDDEYAYPHYRELRDAYLSRIAPYTELSLENGYGFVAALGQALVLFCVKNENAEPFEELRISGQDSNAYDQNRMLHSTNAKKFAKEALIEKPLIIVSAPRSGSTMLFEALSKHSDVYTIGSESHRVIEAIDVLHPSLKNYDSNALDAQDCSQDISAKLHADFYGSAHKNNGRKPVEAEVIRLLEKTPKNALRIPFITKLFPDASFIYLYRDPRHVISSMIDAWQSGRFQTYPQLPGWTGQAWSLLLVPGWRSLIGKPLHHIVAYQWATTSRLLLDALENMDSANIQKVRYETFVLHPQIEINRLCQVFGLSAKEDISALPLSQHTLTPPHPDKWKRNADLIDEIWPMVEDQAVRAEKFIDDVT
jgi:hypothetical protein